MPIPKKDIPILQEISIAHGCKNTTKEFFEFMISEYNDHCFVSRQSSDLHCITGFIIATNDKILELVTGYKYKKERPWLLKRCKESYEFGTELQFTMSKQLESELKQYFHYLDFEKISENDIESTYVCKHILYPFCCGTC